MILTEETAAGKLQQLTATASCKTMTAEKNEPKTPAHEIYQELYKELKLNPRTVQWYATEGYIPKPIKEGGTAFYTPSAQIMTRIRVIQMLQKRFDLKLKEVKSIVDQQGDSDWEEIYNLFTAMESFFPLMEFDYNGNESVSTKGFNIAKIVCSHLKERSYTEVKLEEIEEEFDQMLKEDPTALYNPFE